MDKRFVWALLACTQTMIFCGVARADDLDGWLDGWSERAHAALASQPHWIPPIMTVTPRLTQVVRYDQYRQDTNAGASLDSFDSGKGVEIIPLETLSLTFNLPPYDARGRKSTQTGWGDWPFLLVKQRLAAAPEGQGNYIVTAEFSMQAPVGAAAFTNHAWLATPALGFGKGWGDWDVQGSIGATIPTARADAIGTAIASNLLLQYHAIQYLWPEVELNDTDWSGGPRDGRNQLFMTAGVVLGSIPLIDNYGGSFGVGYQFALSPRPAIIVPALTPTYDHNWILTFRLAY